MEGLTQLKGVNMKLTIELVPKSAWYANLRNLVGRYMWEKKIAKDTKDKYGYKCGICGDQAHRLECHELWEYDDEQHVQKLVGFIALCSYCHKVKHMGHTKILAQQGYVDLEEVFAHFCKVNNCTIAEYRNHEKAAFKQWRERSQYKWTPDFGEYAQYIKKGGE